MSATKFTPGPWVKRGKGTIETGNGGDIASVLDGRFSETVDRETQEANAHLIAAAPDLYAVVSMLEGWLNGSHNDEYGLQDIGEATEAALSKARGEQ